MVEEEVVVAGNAYSVGPFDVVLLLSFVGILLYLISKKREEQKKPVLNGLADLKQLNINTTAASMPTGFVEKMKTTG